MTDPYEAVIAVLTAITGALCLAAVILAYADGRRGGKE